MKSTIAIVLAAGKGTRMKSELPKVLFEVNGRPMIRYVLDALSAAGVEKTVVVIGYRADLVRETLADVRDLIFIEQTEQLGTGHAVMVCRPQLAEFAGSVVVVTGDSPMLRAESIRSVVDEVATAGVACVLGTAHKDDPHGLGRIVRDEAGRFAAIVEEKDADDKTRAVQEVNMSLYVFRAPDLLFALDRLDNDNSQREYYVTDCPGILKRAGREVRALDVLHPSESLSVNNLEELAVVEATMRAQGGA